MAQVINYDLLLRSPRTYLAPLAGFLGVEEGDSRLNKFLFTSVRASPLPPASPSSGADEVDPLIRTGPCSHSSMEELGSKLQTYWKHRGHYKNVPARCGPRGPRTWCTATPCTFH